MWIESESSGAYSCYEEFVEDTVPYLRKEMELMLASVRASEQRVLAQVGLLSPPASMHMLVLVRCKEVGRRKPYISETTGGSTITGGCHPLSSKFHES